MIKCDILLRPAIIPNKLFELFVVLGVTSRCSRPRTRPRVRRSLACGANVKRKEITIATRPNAAALSR